MYTLGPNSASSPIPMRPSLAPARSEQYSPMWARAPIVIRSPLHSETFDDITTPDSSPAFRRGET